MLRSLSRPVRRFDLNLPSRISRTNSLTSWIVISGSHVPRQDAIAENPVLATEGLEDHTVWVPRVEQLEQPRRSRSPGAGDEDEGLERLIEVEDVPRRDLASKSPIALRLPQAFEQAVHAPY